MFVRIDHGSLIINTRMIKTIKHKGVRPDTYELRMLEQNETYYLILEEDLVIILQAIEKTEGLL